MKLLIELKKDLQQTFKTMFVEYMAKQQARRWKKKNTNT